MSYHGVSYPFTNRLQRRSGPGMRPRAGTHPFPLERERQEYLQALVGSTATAANAFPTSPARLLPPDDGSLPARAHGALTDPDFVKHAESFGAKGYRSGATGEPLPTLRRAPADDAPLWGDLQGI
jgi:hypothetical protein